MPLFNGFKPFGTSFSETEAITLLVEEYEAVKLTEYLNLTQEEAALKMNVSRPTFTRIYEKARKTIAEAFVEGKIIVIQGGDIDIDNEYTNHKKEKVKYQVGKGGYCICLKCELRLKHKKGQPCRDQKCPECGEFMFCKNSYHHKTNKDNIDWF